VSTDTPGPIIFTALRDPVIEAVGFYPTHRYVEECWLPLLGPTAVLLLRHVGYVLGPEAPYTITVDELRRVLGLGSQQKVRLALNRLEKLGLGKWLWHDGRNPNVPGCSCFGLWLAVPPLTTYRVRRLPDTAVRAHRHHTERSTAALGNAAAVAHP
jgi:hypothetical protein